MAYEPKYQERTPEVGHDQLRGWFEPEDTWDDLPSHPAERGDRGELRMTRRQYSPDQQAKRRQRRDHFYAELRRNNFARPATESRDTPEETPNDDQNGG